MSDSKAAGLGLFINKKNSGPSGAAASASVNGGPPKDVKRRWLYVGVGLVGLVVLSSSIFGNKAVPLAAPGPKTPVGSIDTAPKGADQQSFTNQFGKEQERMRAELERLAAEVRSKNTAIEELRKGQGQRPVSELPPGVVAPPVAPGGNTGGLGGLGTSSAPPPGPPIPPRLAPPVSSPPMLPGILPSNPGGAPMMTPPENSGNPLIFEAPERQSTAKGAAGGSGAGVSAKTTFKKNDSVGMLPAGAFAPVALLNGVDAGTSTATQNNPMPILFNITEHATLPGAAKYRLKNCFVLGTAYGDLSAERVYGRISRLSCVDKADRLVLSQEVAGYLVDSDGKLGLRGAISDRQGAKLGKALLAGFAQGLAGALGQAQGSTLSNPTLGTTTTSISGGAAARAAGLTGAQTATSQLADFYLKEAQAIFPVITVDAGRTGTIIFSNAIALNWADNDNKYVPQTTPTN